MKKLFVMMAVAVLCTLSASAQRSGKRQAPAPKSSTGVYLGGGIYLWSISNDNNDETRFGISPEIGYRLSDKWSIGVVVGYSTTGSGDQKNTNFNIRPYVRQNIVSLGKVDFILDYNVFYQNSGLKHQKTNSYGLGVRPGLSMDINRKLTVVTHVGNLQYSSSKLDVEGAKSTSTVGFNLSSANVSLSLFYNF